MDPGAHLTLNAKINDLEALTLVDSGATGVFMHPTFALKCNAIIQTKKVPREVRVIDGRVINSGLITHEAQVELVIGDHRETLVADITNVGRYACILGTPWLTRHDPTIRWSRREVLFDSSYCQKNCVLRNGEVPIDKDMSGYPEEKWSADEVSGRLETSWGAKQLASTGWSTERSVTSTSSGLISTAPEHALVSWSDFKKLAKEAELFTLEISECEGGTGSSIPEEYSDLRGAFSEEASNQLPKQASIAPQT